MTRHVRILLAASGFLLAVAAPKGAAQDAGALQHSASYIIGPHDVLLVTVWNQPDVSGKYTVEQDGSFTFPLLGRVATGGLTLRALELELSRQLADGLFKDPQVTVSVLEGTARLTGPRASAMTALTSFEREGKYRYAVARDTPALWATSATDGMLPRRTSRTASSSRRRNTRPRWPEPRSGRA